MLEKREKSEWQKKTAPDIRYRKQPMCTGFRKLFFDNRQRLYPVSLRQFYHIITGISGKISSNGK